MGIIAFWGPPGSGKTTCAVDTAFALSRSGKSVLLISAEPYAELAAVLQIKITTRNCLAAAYAQPGILKQVVCQADELLFALCVKNGCDVFADEETQRNVKELLKQARTVYDYVLVDCPSHATMALEAWAMRMAAQVVIMTGCRSSAAEWFKSYRQAIFEVNTKITYVCAEINRYYDYEALYQLIDGSPAVLLPHINNAALIQEKRRTLLDTGMGTGNKRNEITSYRNSVQKLCGRLGALR